MEIEFDPAKDAANVAKHGVSLAMAAGLDFRAIVPDARVNYGEARFNAFGLIDGVGHCLTFTLRGEVLRVISLRRAHAKEYDRYVD